MHVLMFAERLPPSIGGVERHIQELVPELTQRGVKLTLAAPAHQPGLPLEDELNGAQVLRIPYTRGKYGTYASAWRWWFQHRDLLVTADRIHFHGVYSLWHWFGPAHALCWNKPHYLTYHGGTLRCPPQRRERFYRKLSTRMIRSGILVGDYLRRWYQAPDLPVTYGAVQLPDPVPPLPEQSSALYLGRLDNNTSLDIYLNALHHIKTVHNLTLPLTVCGDGSRRADWEALTRQLDLPVTFRGFVLDPAPYLARASVVFASTYLSILEALAYRRPVFSVYNNPLLADYLDGMPGAGTAFGIAGDADRLASQLRAHLQGEPGTVDPARGAEFAAQASWSALADLYLQIWEIP